MVRVPLPPRDCRGQGNTNTSQAGTGPRSSAPRGLGGAHLLPSEKAAESLKYYSYLQR
jgi:hypothetical protein